MPYSINYIIFALASQRVLLMRPQIFSRLTRPMMFFSIIFDMVIECVICQTRKQVSRNMLLKYDSSGHYVRSRMKTVWLILGILLVAANLRAAITGLGPLVDAIRLETHLSNTVTGMLTALPLLAFAALSPVAPKISRKIGMEMTLFLSMIVLIVGILLRSYASVVTLFMGTIIIG